MKIVRSACIAAAFAATLFVTDASATRDPANAVVISSSFRVQMQNVRDASTDADVQDTIDAALLVFNTEQDSVKKALKKNAKEIKNLEKVIGENATYIAQADLLIGGYRVAMSGCGLEAAQAILNGPGSLIAKAKKSASWSRKLVKAGAFADNADKPRHKRIKKMAVFIGKATKVVNKLSK
jgi:hypothetical protein